MSDKNLLIGDTTYPHTPAKKYCKGCAAFRSGDICQKCQGETFVPCEGFTECKLPDIELIRKLAKEVGYAVGVHGTQERDLDIIAAPWTDDAVNSWELMQHIAKGLNAHIIDKERKPLGRHAATIQIDGWYKPLDISICPILSDPVQVSQPVASIQYIDGVKA